LRKEIREDEVLWPLSILLQPFRDSTDKYRGMNNIHPHHYHQELLRRLIRKSDTIDKRTGCISLHNIASCGYVKSTQYFLDKGVDVNAKSGELLIHLGQVRS
jgi:hypothetical protein